MFVFRAVETFGCAVAAVKVWVRVLTSSDLKEGKKTLLCSMERWSGTAAGLGNLHLRAPLSACERELIGVCKAGVYHCFVLGLKEDLF